MTDQYIEYGRENRLLDLLGQLPDELLDEAMIYRKPVAVRRKWSRSGLMAACLCAVLLGSLAWESLHEEAGFGQETTMAGVGEDTMGAAAGGAVTGTSGSTGSVPTEAVANGENIGFWYEGQWYVPAVEAMLTELPEEAKYLCPLYRGEDNTSVPMKDWHTAEISLVGSKVYRIEGVAGFLVEEESGYRHYVVKEEAE